MNRNELGKAGGWRGGGVGKGSGVEEGERIGCLPGVEQQIGYGINKMYLF